VLKPPARRTSPTRLMIAGLITLALSLLVWGGALLWTRSRPAGPQRDAAEDGNRALILERVQEGRQAGESGNWGAAAYYFREAEKLDPKSRRIRDLKKAAEERLSQQSSEAAGKASIVSMGLANASQALAAQSWEAAQTAAATVLEIDPENADARAILVKAQEGAARKARQQQRRAQATPQAAPGTVPSALAPATSEQPARPTAPTARPEATTATLRIHFRSELPEATVVVYANRKEVFRKTYGGRGLFRKGGGPVEGSDTASVPAGAVDLLVNVTPGGKAALVRKPSGNFPGGGTRALEIHLSDPTQIAVDLR
jgi:hypothetical protein